MIITSYLNFNKILMRLPCWFSNISVYYNAEKLCVKRLERRDRSQGGLFLA